MLAYTQVIAGAGNETTGRLIGWLGRLLGDHPDQRRALVEDRSLIPNAIEETLRFQPTGLHLARYVMRDVEYYGTTVPAGSAMLLLVGSANRDERRHADPDRFDVRRDLGPHLTFGYGLHFCLGASLARLEGRVALDEVLNRFPDWEVDDDERHGRVDLHGARLRDDAGLRALTSGRGREALLDHRAHAVFPRDGRRTGEREALGVVGGNPADRLLGDVEAHFLPGQARRSTRTTPRCSSPRRLPS